MKFRKPPQIKEYQQSEKLYLKEWMQLINPKQD